MKLKQTSIELKTQRSRINCLITNASIKTSVLLLNKPFLTNKNAGSPYNPGLSLRYLPSKSFSPSSNALPFQKTKFKYPLQVLVLMTSRVVDDNIASIFNNSRHVVLAQWGASFSSCFFLISKKIQIESFLSSHHVYRTFSCLLTSK